MHVLWLITVSLLMNLSPVCLVHAFCTQNESDKNEQTVDQSWTIYRKGFYIYPLVSHLCGSQDSSASGANPIKLICFKDKNNLFSVLVNYQFRLYYAKMT